MTITKITHGKTISSLAPGSFVTLEKVNPTGALQARLLTTGTVMFYWRFTLDGKTSRQPIGVYSSIAPPKSITPTDDRYSVNAALRAAEAMAVRHHTHIDQGGHVALKTAAQEAREAARIVKRSRPANPGAPAAGLL